MSDIEQVQAANAVDTKKNKMFASVIQKEMKNVEKAKKLLGIVFTEEIPEIDAAFEETVKKAIASVEAVNTKLSVVHKVYTKDVAPTTKKTSSRVDINLKARVPK